MGGGGFLLYTSMVVGLSCVFHIIENQVILVLFRMKTQSGFNSPSESGLGIHAFLLNYVE